MGAVRDLAKAERATQVVHDAARAFGGSFGLAELDLGSLATVRAGADLAELIQPASM